MFIPNTRAYWLKKADKRTLTGKDSFSAPRLIPLSIVSIKDTSAPTSVRADSSGSRGAAEQHEAAAKVLIPPQFAIQRGDVLRIADMKVQITTIEPRRDIFGKLDHNEVDCEIHADG